MKRKHPFGSCFPGPSPVSGRLLQPGACRRCAPGGSRNTVAPYTPTEQEQTLLQAYELTQDNTVAFTFQNPEEILGLFVQIYRLGEDGTWKNVDEIAVGSLLPPQAEGLITLQLEDSRGHHRPGPLSGQPAGGKCSPWRGTSSPGPRGSSPSPSPSSGTNPSPSPCWPTPRPGTPAAQDDTLGKITLQDFFSPENLTGLDQVQAVTVTFSSEV